MSDGWLRNLGKVLPARWRRSLKRGVLLRHPSLYASRAVRYEQGLSDGELDALLSKLSATRDVPGDVVECGCFLCGTSVRMAQHLRQRNSTKRIYACDTFSGFDPVEFALAKRHGDARPQRDFAENDFHYVRHKIDRLGLSDRIILVKGRFQDTLESVPGPFSFAFIDCDLPDSILYAAQIVWSELSPGGCCIFDDYANKDFPGATRAIDTFLAEQADTIGTHGQLSTKLYFASKKSV